MQEYCGSVLAELCWMSTQSLLEAWCSALYAHQAHNIQSLKAQLPVMLQYWQPDLWWEGDSKGCKALVLEQLCWGGPRKNAHETSMCVSNLSTTQPSHGQMDPVEHRRLSASLPVVTKGQAQSKGLLAAEPSSLSVSLGRLPT